MGFLRNLFLGSGNNNSNSKVNNKDSLKKGSWAYESTVALEPPVKGSYPVAGNGNVEETLLRARQRRDSRQSQSRAPSFVGSFRPPTIPSDRPRTAPQNGVQSGVQYASSMGGIDRTRSGFSMKDPPLSLSSSNRRNSLRSTQSPPPAIPLPSIPNSPARQIQTYQPRKSGTPVSDTNSNGASLHQQTPTAAFTLPYAESNHQRNFSQASFGSHVDVLDAYSTMRPKEVSKHRVKASGVRVYGEDVADRNIADFGDRELSKLDMNSPEFGYMKSVYARAAKSEKRHENRGDDAVAQHEQVQQSPDASFHGDDTHKTSYPLSLPTSRFSTSTNTTTTISTTQITPQGQHHHYYHSGAASPSTIPPNNNDQGLEHSNNVGSSSSQYVTIHNSSSRSGVPLSKQHEQFSVKHSSRRDDISSSPLAVVSQENQSSIGHNHSPPPVDPSRPIRLPSTTQLRAQVNSAILNNTQPASTPSPLRISSTPDSHKVASFTNNSRPTSQHARTVSRGSYSAFPQTSSRDQSLSPTSPPNSSRQMATAQRKLNYVIEGAKEAPSLEGVIRLGNSEQTHVTTTTLPAVTHEFVRPTLHEIRTEKVTREIHTYDIFHRIQPIIETVILPTKHYIHSPDGKSLIEIPESQIPGRTGVGAANRNWKIVPTSLGQGDYAPPSQQTGNSRSSFVPPRTVASQVDEYDQSAGSPAVDNRGTSRSLASNNNPILASKKESISPEGIPRTEYLWRHKPQFENVRRPQDGPHYVGAGIGEISEQTSRVNGRSSDSSSDYSGERDYTLKNPQDGRSQQDENLVFRDSGYGAGDRLPGINAGGDLSREFDRMTMGKESSARPFDPRTGATSDGSPREVRTKKSSVDLRRVAGQQEGVSY